MSNGRRLYQRKTATRRYSPRFHIVTEGAKTELQYFTNILGCRAPVVRVIASDPRRPKTSPRQLLARAKVELKHRDFNSKSDQIWIVADRDDWPVEQLSAVAAWVKESANRGFAFSNPKFEYWLLLHFDDGRKSKKAKAREKKLKTYIPKYDKELKRNDIAPQRVHDAINRARAKDSAREIWSKADGVTTVYRLVEEIIEWDLASNLSKV